MKVLNEISPKKPCGTPQIINGPCDEVWGTKLWVTKKYLCFLLLNVTPYYFHRSSHILSKIEEKKLLKMQMQRISKCPSISQDISYRQISWKILNVWLPWPTPRFYYRHSVGSGRNAKITKTPRKKLLKYVCTPTKFS